MRDESKHLPSSLIPYPSSLIFMNVQRHIAGEHSGEGTRQRIIACRRRLREARAAQRSAQQVSAVAALAASEVMGNSVDDPELTDFADGLGVTETSARQPARSFVPSVDRRAPVRAR